MLIDKQIKYEFNYYFLGDITKSTILFLHGFMGNCEEFDDVISLLLASNSFSFLTIDLPGHGKTKVLGNDDCYTMELTAQGIICLLDELKIWKCFLVGYSMGGRLALYLTIHFPQRFSKVILESASPGLLTAVERLARIKSDNQIARKLNRLDITVNREGFAAFLATWYNQPIFGNIKYHPHYHHLIANRMQNNPSELAKSLYFMGTGNQPSLWEKIQTNTQPLLLLVGKYDYKFVDINTRMLNACKYCNLNIISGAGHNIHFEQPDIFAERVVNFLSH
ncbi:MAG: 2-succinyl-6-hydroxy-2,4-cyclohexadiene-1-carboxylate synthase [Calothrix sp. C42_A2020_038]|nr:2-succinyl-6-hydroxy-2,4-cyclohexadiene-1-carboxylate synthase [Calothrix sp. C42_A2020_038]